MTTSITRRGFMTAGAGVALAGTADSRRLAEASRDRLLGAVEVARRSLA